MNRACRERLCEYEQRLSALDNAAKLQSMQLEHLSQQHAHLEEKLSAATAESDQ